ncbi:hypothetical protein [Roseobacter sinensis]|uniref:Uncharacterized protein n=1 Tax=Roseobacter sinensis TaxID=2931391 RepID=A0ABT3BA46_9RHOB|nr:hypothetical protein [Roseobacter sp. WL0113]MCV3270446.1 hypothetical protein [Roseobacter sp. WL0113]
MGKFDYSASRKLLHEIAYESACESLSQQRADLRALRSQASVVAAVSGLTGTLFSRLVFEAAESHGGSIFDASSFMLGLPFSVAMAIFSFSTSIVFALRILSPSKGWRFEDSPKALIEKLEKKGPSFSDPELLRTLSMSKESRFDRNEVLLGRAQRDMFTAIVFTFLQLPFWGLTFFIFGGS